MRRKENRNTNNWSQGNKNHKVGETQSVASKYITISGKIVQTTHRIKAMTTTVDQEITTKSRDLGTIEENTNKK